MKQTVGRVTWMLRLNPIRWEGQLPPEPHRWYKGQDNGHIWVEDRKHAKRMTRKEAHALRKKWPRQMTTVVRLRRRCATDCGPDCPHCGLMPVRE